MLTEAENRTDQAGQARSWADMPAVMKKSAYGEYRRSRFGVGSPPMVTKWIREQKITPPALRDDGTIDRVLADRQLAERLDPARSNAADLLDDEQLEDSDPADDLPEDFEDFPAAAKSGVQEGVSGNGAADAAAVNASYNEERIAHVRAQRQLKEMELAERAGRLVEKANVEAAQFDMARMVRDRLLGLASEVAGALVGKEERDIAARLRDAIAEKLSSISDEIDDATGAG